MNKKVISGVSAFGVAVIGTGIYLAGPASAGGSAQDTAAKTPQHQAGQQNARQKARKAIRRRGVGVHGEATVRTKKNGFVEVAWQRGTVTAKSGTTITVRSLDGTTWQWQTDAKTRVRKQGEKAALTNVGTNDFIIIAGQQGAGNRHTAKRIFDPKKVPAKATQSPAPAHS